MAIRHGRESLLPNSVEIDGNRVPGKRRRIVCISQTNIMCLRKRSGPLRKKMLLIKSMKACSILRKLWPGDSRQAKHHITDNKKICRKELVEEKERSQRNHEQSDQRKEMR